MWKPGTWIVCIDDEWRDDEGKPPAPGEAPKVGEYCTVHSCYSDPDFESGYKVQLREYLADGDEFCAGAFRLAESDHSESKNSSCTRSIDAP